MLLGNKQHGALKYAERRRVRTDEVWRGATKSTHRTSTQVRFTRMHVHTAVWYCVYVCFSYDSLSLSLISWTSNLGLISFYFHYPFSLFLLLVHYVPNVAKRSTWEQCILRTDDRPTSHFGKFWMAISRQRVIQSTSCLVLVGFSRLAGWTKSKMASGCLLGKCWMAIFLQRVMQFTLRLVLW